jgi:nicotinamidase-related amidase
LQSIFLIMDMINDLVGETDAGPKSFKGEVERRSLIANIRRARDKADAAGAAVGYVRLGFSPDYRECPENSPQFGPAKKNGLFKLGSWGTEVCPELAPRPGDFDIVKHRVSAFFGTNLTPLLGANGIRRLYLAGVSTTYVVQATARDAHDRDYEVVVLEDCCAALSQEEHDWSIKALTRPARIATSNDVEF